MLRMFTASVTRATYAVVTGVSYRSSSSTKGWLLFPPLHNKLGHLYHLPNVFAARNAHNHNHCSLVLFFPS